MKAGKARMILGRLRQMLPPDGGATDGLLLGRYASRRDDDAFAVLVRRHGPMVLSVCRRVLHHAQDAEDAFQATFLVLARKAGSVGGREAVAGWLYRVAYRAALAARAHRGRREARERQVEAMPHPIAPPEDDQRELLEMLDRELARLPEKYRLPVVLCELEGRSRKDAAKQLGLPEGTLSSRLAAARKTLAARLSRGGAAPSAGALGMLFAQGARAASVPGRLLLSTVRVAGGVVPAGVAALTEGVMKSMLLTKLKATAWGLLLAASLSVGAIALTYRPAAAQPAPKPDAPRAANSLPDRDDLESLRLEVEALRLDLKATKERVKVLEEAARKGGAEDVKARDLEQLKLLEDARLRSGAAKPDPKPAAANNVSQGGGKPGTPGAVAPAAEAPGDVDAAMQKLRQHPDDKQALDVLESAVKRLRQESQKLEDEAEKLDEFVQAVQKLKGASPPKPTPLTPPREN
ncbi:MAG TPA: sigma-70 family RNA polymerase sigma factor [Gemmataceae bacterium]|nr:sigma-70 family RNA polymerase sigma factor [Gemmataceae bacterium]